MYEVVIIWKTGEKEVHPFECREMAEKVVEGFKTAYENQVEWVGIRKGV